MTAITSIQAQAAAIPRLCQGDRETSVSRRVPDLEAYWCLRDVGRLIRELTFGGAPCRLLRASVRSELPNDQI
jgi:hypothetical protein